MSKPFSPDSKLMSMLAFVGDIFLINLIYIISCIPIITIGAAQAGLHTAAQILQDPTDDRSAIKGYFRGFSSGFGRITLAWGLFLVFDAILYYTLSATYYYSDIGISIHWGIPLVVLCVSLVYQTILCLFHSRFSCTFPQLIHNCVVMFIWHPLASSLSAALMCLPMIIFLLMPQLFLEISSLFLTVYFPLAALIIYTLTQKSFQTLIDEINNSGEVKSDV